LKAVRLHRTGGGQRASFFRESFPNARRTALRAAGRRVVKYAL
jgi:hypothetical protein